MHTQIRKTKFYKASLPVTGWIIAIAGSSLARFSDRTERLSIHASIIIKSAEAWIRIVRVLRNAACYARVAYVRQSARLAPIRENGRSDEIWDIQVRSIPAVEFHGQIQSNIS